MRLSSCHCADAKLEPFPGDPEKCPNMHLINIDPQASPVPALPQDRAGWPRGRVDRGDGEVRSLISSICAIRALVATCRRSWSWPCSWQGCCRHLSPFKLANWFMANWAQAQPQGRWSASCVAICELRSALSPRRQLAELGSSLHTHSWPPIPVGGMGNRTGQVNQVSN